MKRAEEQDIRLRQEDERGAKDIKRAATSSRPALSVISPATSPTPLPALTVTKPTPEPALTVTKPTPAPASPPAKTPISVTATATQTGQGEIIEQKVNGVTNANGIHGVNGVNGVGDNPGNSVSTHL